MLLHNPGRIGVSQMTLDLRDQCTQEQRMKEQLRCLIPEAVNQRQAVELKCRRIL